MPKPFEITAEICCEAFSEALRAEIGPGKPFTIDSASDGLGIDERTLRSYLSGENLPPFRNIVRMFSLFGTSFTNRVLHIAGIDGAEQINAKPVGDLELNADITRVAGNLGQALRKGFLAPNDRKKLMNDIRQLIGQEKDWLVCNTKLMSSARFNATCGAQITQPRTTKSGKKG